MAKKTPMYGTKIKAFRTIRNFPQEYMAEKLHIAQNTYSKLENNKQEIKPDMLEKIADVLGVTVADIVSQLPIVINNQASNQGTQIGHNENFYTYQKEMLDSFKQITEAVLQSNERILKLLEERGK